jgi:arginase
VLLVGARNIDPVEQSAIEQRGFDVVPADLPDGDLFPHINNDNCDPTVVPDLLLPAPRGPGLDAVVRRLDGDRPGAAVDLAATWHHNGPTVSTPAPIGAPNQEAITS